MLKVLLVDDEMFARKGLLGLIPWSEYGFEIVGEAEDGGDALELIEKLQPDVVLTDIRMPELDGLELIGRVQKNAASNPKFIIISGYNDFSYAQQAVRYGVQDFLLKPIDEQELIETLVRAKLCIEKELVPAVSDAAMMEQTLLEQLLNGKLSAELASEAGIRLGLPAEGLLSCMIIEINNWSEAIEGKEQDRIDTLKAAMMETVRHVMEGKYVPSYEIDNFTLCLVVTLPYGYVNNPEEWSRLGERLQRGIKNNVQEQADTRLYIGDACRGLVGLSDSYASAVESRSYKYACPEQPVLHHENLDTIVLKYTEMNPEIYTGLIHRVEEADRDAAQAMIRELFDAFRARYAPESIASSISRCVLGITRIIKTMQGDEKQLASLKPILHWQQTPLTLEGLQGLFEAFVEESVTYMTELRKNNALGEIQRVKQYIESNYAENINLKSIAKQYYMNPVYLGQLFRRTYGVYFNEFLLALRIQEAKRLLRQTDLRIYEIATKVGYSNSDYFVTQFEKVEAKTPTEYRQELLSKI